MTGCGAKDLASIIKQVQDALNGLGETANSGWLKQTAQVRMMQLDVLDTIDALGAETIVPGHGAVCGPEVIGEVRAYVRFVLDAARKGFDAGVPAGDVAKDLDLGQFAELTDAERIVPNLHRAYSEFRGEPRATPLPQQEMFQAMIAYNGGQPLRCLA